MAVSHSPSEPTVQFGTRLGQADRPEAPYFPDGIDDTAFDALLAEAARERANAPAPTWALLDGSAAENRRRRAQRRAIAAVVRSLPVRPTATTRPTDIKEAS
jgi:hypothetical protein